MAASETFDQLIDLADQAVQKTLQYFEGSGAQSAARVDRWGVWEVAAHMLFWHRATTEAAVAVGRGGPALRHTVNVDVLNEDAVGKTAGTTLADIVAQLKQSHQELLAAIRELPDPDAVLMYRADGSAPTGRDRMRTIARHWTGHLEQLQAAAGT
mgnify:CR=1 FL=1|tara:strand:+ start:424 stop:888 length:465 start_codon:yes stop_codon:yes gene_type:complete